MISCFVIISFVVVKVVIRAQGINLAQQANAFLAFHQIKVLKSQGNMKHAVQQGFTKNANDGSGNYNYLHRVPVLPLKKFLEKGDEQQRNLKGETYDGHDK